MEDLDKSLIEDILTPKDVSRLLKVSRPWPYVMVKRGLLPHYKMGEYGKKGVIRFRRGDIEAYLARCRVEGKGIGKP